MYLHILENKGDFLFRDWDETGLTDYKNKIKELKNIGYTIESITEDSLNEYTKLKNAKNNDIKTITLMRC